jgi:two-component system sensor histidine kinase/response regulator
MASAERGAHALRGVAANLGARTVQAAAAEFEAAVHAQAAPEQLDALRGALADVLAPFVEQLRAALGAEPPAPGPGAGPGVVSSDIDPATRATVVAQMRRHLADCDAAASEYLDAHRALFAAILPGDAFGLFERRVRDYAFDEAQAQLQQVAPVAGAGVAGAGGANA